MGVVGIVLIIFATLVIAILALPILLVLEMAWCKRRYVAFRKHGRPRPSIRTPDERFADLRDFPFAPHYVEIDGLRMHFIDEGPRDAAPILLLHGEPSWSYLYRKMIPALVAAGHRVVAPDLIGFGKSDKLTRQCDYTYQMHVDCVGSFVEALDLRNATLFCQDWGGLIGLWVALDHAPRFARIVASNTGLPGKPPRGEFKPITERAPASPWLGFVGWFLYSQLVPKIPVGRVVQMGARKTMSPEVAAAYDAPFPDHRYQAGVRKFPRLVPSEFKKNTEAWLRYAQWQKPFLTAFSSGDPITRGIDRAMQRVIPGAQGQSHTTVRGAGHFVQEDKGEELAEIVNNFIRQTS